MDTTHFFRQVSADQFTGSMAYLESQQALFHSDQTSGMIKIRSIRQNASSCFMPGAIAPEHII